MGHMTLQRRRGHGGCQNATNVMTFPPDEPLIDGGVSVRYHPAG